MELRPKMRSGIIAALVSVIALGLPLVGCQQSGGLSEDMESTQQNVSEKAPKPVGTPYERVIESGGGNTDLLVPELKQYVDEYETTFYRITGTVSKVEDFDKAKMYSVDNPDPSRFIEIHFDDYTEVWDHNETGEMTLYLKPYGLLLDEQPLCKGGVSEPTDGTTVKDIDFEELYDLCETFDTATVTVTGFAELYFKQPGFQTHYYLYESADALIDADEEKRVIALLDPDEEVKEGSEITVKAPPYHGYRKRGWLLDDWLDSN